MFGLSHAGQIPHSALCAARSCVTSSKFLCKQGFLLAPDTNCLTYGNFLSSGMRRSRTATIGIKHVLTLAARNRNKIARVAHLSAKALPRKSRKKHNKPSLFMTAKSARFFCAMIRLANFYTPPPENCVRFIPGAVLRRPAHRAHPERRRQ